MNRRYLPPPRLSVIAARPHARQTPSAEQRFASCNKELVRDEHQSVRRQLHAGRERMAARLKAAGFTDEELHLFTAPGHPGRADWWRFIQAQRELKAFCCWRPDVGRGEGEDWTRDPFTLVEENGNFYARGPWTTRPKVDLVDHACALP